MSSSESKRETNELPPEAVSPEDWAAHDAFVRRKVERALEAARRDPRRYSLDEVMRRFGIEG